MDLNKVRRKIEIETLYELLDRLNYYQILALSTDAAQAEIEPAFRNAAREMHPDRATRLGDKTLIRKVTTIYRTIGEAHKVLKDPDRRVVYDQELADGKLRISDDGESGGNDPEKAAKTEKGQKYWLLALQQWRDGDYNGCTMNIQFALNFEKDNEIFKEWLDRSKKKAQESDSKKEKNPYKLRLV